MLSLNSSLHPRGIIIPLFKAAGITFLASSMIIFPRETFQAAFRGLDAWWSIVFPALLPFFIVSELLIGLGVVNFLGVLMEPIMRPLFNVPGAGAFVMAMGYTSGAPIGTMLSVELRKKNLCSRIEAQRLMSFTNNTSPLFLFGAVSVGMFHEPTLGITLALSHYAANIIVGLILRFWGSNTEETTQPHRRGNIVVNAFQALLEAQRNDRRPTGTLLADAVKKSAHTLTMVGGFVIFFSVLIEILKLMGILKFISTFLMFLLKPFGLDPRIAPAVATGFFEVTLGTKLASETPVILPVQLIATSVILGWGGLSIHAQVASLLKDTDIKMGMFFAARSLHAAIAPLITMTLMGPIQPVVNIVPGAEAVGTWQGRLFITWAALVAAGLLVCIALCMLAALFVIVFYLLRRLTIIKINS